MAPPALTAGVVSMFAPVAMAQSVANSRTITIFSMHLPRSFITTFSKGCSGGGCQSQDIRRSRWNFIALWGAITRTGGSDPQASSFITGVYKNVDVLPKDAREATDLFVKRRHGDVLMNWETEAIIAKRKGEWTTSYRLFSPNVLTEQPVTLVDKVVDRRGSRKLAEAFVKFLFMPVAQKVFVDNDFRLVTPDGKAYARGKFQDFKFFNVGDFRGRSEADKTFFGKDAIWDQIFRQCH